jgi:flagellar protein FlbD
MIDLTRLNGHRLVLNCDLLKFVEATPDTTLTLVTGEKLIVRESCDQLIALAAQWRAHILTTAWPDAAHAFAAKSGFDAVHPVELHQPAHGTDHSS